MKKHYFLLTIVALLFSYGSYGQAGCSGLDILTTTAGSVCGEGSVTLEATSSGTGDEVVWYDAAVGGDIVGTGTSFQTPVITTTSSYWATEVLFDGTVILGSVETVFTAGASNGVSGAGSVVTFAIENTNSSQITITDLENYMPANSVREHELWYHPTNLSGSPGSITTADGWILAAGPQTSTSGSSDGVSPVLENISFSIPGNTTYRFGLVATAIISGSSSFTYWGNNTTPAAPNNFTDSGVNLLVGDNTAGGTGNVGYGGNISGPTNNPRAFYGKVDFESIDILCESPREEVIATVDNNGDEDVLSLPYTHTANTATYGNSYSGVPGTDCGSTDSYLNGNDVVYKYTADDDYILTIELSGLSEAYSGVFIYESCLDIGATCFAEGSVNETTGTHSFQVSVTDLQDYYIVVSSADPTVSMDYTLTINGTTCANYSAPAGSATQNFIDDQTLVDLDVTGPNLTWYSDAATTTVIPDDTVLVNNTTYYVTQTFQGCESAALAITVTEVTCASLEVLSTTPGSVCGEGSVILEAQGAEASVNTEIHWFDAATGGNMVGKGSPFRTPELEQTTSFWAAEVAISGQVLAGQGYANPPAVSNVTTNNWGLIFEVTDEITIIDVEVLSTAGGGLIEIELRDINDNNATIASASATLPGGGSATSPIPVTVPLDFQVPPGDYRLLKTSGPGIGYTVASNTNFPYPLGSSGEITSGSTATGTTTTYRYFFNWTIFEGNVLCESSPREEVIATVNDVADELVTEPLPFVHTATTSTYGNNYEGGPGSDCNASGGNYLDGNDVVYQYSPTVGGVYSIDLSGLSSNNAAVFVYESCYDIGTACYAGAVSDGTTGDFGIAEVPMYDGFDYFIVISTSDSPSTDYTLTIDLATINCVDYTAAPGGDEDQFFEPGETLADLVVNGGNLTWYSDAAGTNVIPDTTIMVDGTTYYVNQTLNGCVSDLLDITVTEIDCSSLEILSTTDATIVCKGTADLEAVGNGGPGTEIFWYDDAVAGDRVGTGPIFTTPELTATTSYWASEVLIQGQAPMSGQAKPTYTAIASTSGTGWGLVFDAFQNFTIVDVEVYSTGAGGSITIQLQDNTGAMLDETTVTVPGGGSTTTPVPYTAQLNFDVPGPGTYRLINMTAVPMVREFSNNSFPYPVGTVGEVTSGYINGTSGTYYWFYNWTIGTGQVLCESPREEVIATVTQDGDITVPSALPYIDTNNNTSNYGNTFSGAPGADCGTTENYLNGNDVVYMYTPTMDDVIDIHLKDITGFYGGLFVYESCGDIGDNCVAGVVAGASEDDISIEEFTVLNGETYYIVVSSWLSTSIDYTLEINGFVCATFPAPDGDAVQDYAAPATLADLDVEGTMTASVLTWYSDAAGTIVIPDTTPLVDGDTYYVSQTFGTCESPLLAILVEEIDCSNLDIVSTVDGMVVCLGSMTLEAVGSGSGDEIYWYNAASGGDPIAIGSTFTTPPLTSSQSYWAAEVYLEDAGTGGQIPELLYYKFDTGNSIVNDAQNPVGNNPASITGNLTVGGSGLSGTALEGTGSTASANSIQTGWNTNLSGSFTIGFWTSDIPSTSTLYYIFGDSGAGSLRCFTNGVAGNGNWMIRGGGLPDLTAIGAATAASNYIHFVYDAGAGTYTSYVDGVQSETVSAPTSNTMSGSGFHVGGYNSGTGLDGKMDEFRIYNRALTQSELQATIFGPVGGQVLCESPREEVFATVNQTGDKVVTAPLPYSDTDSTLNFGNNFSGDTGCAGVSGNYLDGNDVVYQFTPANDDIINIELSGVGSNTGVFVYETCGDIGGACLAGSVGNGTIEDFFVTGGQDYFIVIGSESGSTSYTLDIYGYDCLTDLDAPEGDADQYFVGTKDLTDLTVDEYIHSTGLTWYSDAAGTNVIPETTTLVDGTTYYVSQSVLGCDSPLLAITANEFACSDLEIVSTTGDVVCQSGSMTLTAQGSGIGNEVYWYSSQTGGNPISVGSVYETPVLTSTTSYWAEEVFIEGSAPLSGQGKPAPIDDANTTLSNYGLAFEATQNFTLMSVDVYPNTSGGPVTVELRENDGITVIQSITVTVPSGNLTTPHTIPLNFNIPIGNYRLMKVGSTNLVREFSAAGGNAFPYPIGTVGQVNGGVFGTGTPNTTYYFFYNWTIGDGIVLCESPRVEAIAEVNTTLPAAPIGNPVQDFCGTDNTVGDLVVTGDNIQWYDASNNPLATSTVLVDGESYFATQTVDACEGDDLEVVVTIIDKSDLPQGDRNQPFVDGETLADLDVVGDDLQWYSDPLGNNPLPETTVLVDQTTYYVSQTEIDLCESETLDIKVHRTLDVDDIAFANLVFYPNPAQDYVTITNTGEVIESVEVFSLLGQRVVQQRVDGMTSTIDVTGLASGPYLLTIKIDGKTGVYKLIKK